MLLAIDMGNTQTAMGLFDGDELVQSWRMPTDRSYTADEIHVRLMGFFKMYRPFARCGQRDRLCRRGAAALARVARHRRPHCRGHHRHQAATAAVTKLRAARPRP